MNHKPDCERRENQNDCLRCAELEKENHKLTKQNKELIARLDWTTL